MASLFLDTSSNICFGLLNEELEWSSFHVHKEVKASKALHQMIYDLLKERGTSMKDIRELFYLSGPGSYTGVRVAQGLNETLELQGVKTLSCRHFDLPKLTGEKSGLFVSRAFKGETFVHEWDENSEGQKLIEEKKAQELLSSSRKRGIKSYTSEPDFYKECLSTYDCLRNDSKKIFGLMRERNLKSDVFYYRNLQDEFSKGKA